MQALISGTIQDVTLPGINVRAKIEMNSRGMNYGVIISPAAHAGKIAIRRKIETLDRFKRTVTKTTWQVVPDIYAAVRREEYIMMAFGRRMDRGERRKIRNALRHMQLLHETILGFVNGIQPDEARKLCERIIEDTATSIGNPLEIKKRKVLEQLIALRNGTDSLGRVNLGAMAARTLSAWDNLDGRLRDMNRMDGYITSRERSFVQLIHMAEMYLESLRHFIDRVEDRFRHGEKPDNDMRRQIGVQCRRYSVIIGCLNINPYRSMSVHAVEDLKNAAEAIRMNEPDVKKVTRLLGKCRAALEIRDVAIQLHRIIYAITMRQLYGTDRPFSLQNVEKRLRQLTRELRSIDETDFSYKVCHRSLAHMKRANKLLNAGVDLSDLEPLRRALKAAAEAL